MLATVTDDLFRAVLQGAPPGTVYALVALGFVLAYKTSGVFNLAFGAQAYASAVLYYKAHSTWHWSILPSLVLAVFLLAPMLGLVLELLVFRHLRTAPPVAGLVVAIGLTVAIPALADIAFNFQPRNGVIPQGIIHNGGKVFYPVFHLYSFSRDEIVAMVVATVAMLSLAALFRFTTIGLRMRAVVESPRMTELNGIAADRISVSAWMLSSLFAGLAGVLIAPRFNNLAAGSFFNIVIVAIAAAALGSLISLPRAYFGGLGLGIVIALFNTFVPKWALHHSWLRPIEANLTPAIPFVVLFLVLVFVPSVRRSRRATDPLSGVDPPPASLAHAETTARADLIRRLVGAAAAIAIFVVVFTRGDSAWLFRISQAIALAVVFLSITVITGYGGHVSLCQGAFAAIGAFTTFQLADRYHVPVLVGALIGMLIAGAVGALLSMPLLRLNGIWIAIATLAFAFFFDSVMVKFSWVGGSKNSAGASLKVARPHLGPWNLDNDRSFLAFALVVLAVATVAVALFGLGTTGRILRAVRGSEVAAQSIGISVARARIVAFTVSAGLAAAGGALLSMQQKTVDYDGKFSPFVALFWLVLIVTFGVRNPRSALIGAAAFSLVGPVFLQGTFLGWILRGAHRIPSVFPLSGKWQFILFGLGTIQYAKHPEGVLEMSRAMRAERRARSAARKAGKSGAATSTPVEAVAQ